MLSHALESWASFYAGHAMLRTAITFLHIGGLVGGGGCAIAADRAALLAARQPTSERAAQIRLLTSTHGVVIAGLVAVTVSGLLLFAADTDTFLYSKVFWLKMGLFALLLINGALLFQAGHRAERGDESAWARLMYTAIASLALWTLTTLAGTALLNLG